MMVVLAACAAAFSAPRQDVDAFRSRLQEQFQEKVPDDPSMVAQEAEEALLRFREQDLKSLALMYVPLEEPFIDCLWEPDDMRETREKLREGLVVVNPRVNPIEFDDAEIVYELRPLSLGPTKCCVYRKYPRPFGIFVKDGEEYVRVANFENSPSDAQIVDAVTSY